VVVARRHVISCLCVVMHLTRDASPILGMPSFARLCDVTLETVHKSVLCEAVLAE